MSADRVDEARELGGFGCETLRVVLLAFYNRFPVLAGKLADRDAEGYEAGMKLFESRESAADGGC